MPQIPSLNCRYGSAPLISAPSKEYPQGYGRRVVFRDMTALTRAIYEPAPLKTFLEEVGVAIVTVENGPLKLDPNALPQKTLTPALAPSYTLPWHVDVRNGIIRGTETGIIRGTETARFPDTWSRGGLQILWQNPTPIGRYPSTLCCPSTLVYTSLTDLGLTNPDLLLLNCNIPLTQRSFAEHVSHIFHTAYLDALTPTAPIMSIRDLFVDRIITRGGKPDLMARFLERISVASIQRLLSQKLALCMDWFRYQNGVMLIWDLGQRERTDVPLLHTRWNRQSTMMEDRSIHSTFINC